MTNAPKRSACLLGVVGLAMSLALVGCAAPVPAAGDAPAAEVESTDSDGVEQPDDTEAANAERAAAIEQQLRDTFGVTESFTELLQLDATMWAGYIADVRVERSNVVVALQVTDDDMFERAASALSTLISAELGDGLSWVIVENGAGVVQAQEQLQPLA